MESCKVWNLHEDSNALHNIISFQKNLQGFNMWYFFFLNMNSKRNYKNLNQQIVINFWMTRLLSYFQEFIFQSFFCCRIKTCKQEPRLFPYLWLFILKYFQNILGIICLTLSISIKVSKSSTSFTRE